VLLGRLRLSIEDAIEEYRVLAKSVFSTRKPKGKDGTFYATNLEKAIQDVVRRHGLPKGEDGKADPSLRLLEPDKDKNACKVFVCTQNARAMDIPRLFRSYKSFSAGDYEEVAIWQACRATSAAPTFFKRMRIGRSGMEEEFIDGGMRTNNPTRVMIKKADTVFGSH